MLLKEMKKDFSRTEISEERVWAQLTQEGEGTCGELLVGRRMDEVTRAARQRRRDSDLLTETPQVVTFPCC